MKRTNEKQRQLSIKWAWQPTRTRYEPGNNYLDVVKSHRRRQFHQVINMNALPFNERLRTHNVHTHTHTQGHTGTHSGTHSYR